jgi:hypothetical protein
VPIELVFDIFLRGPRDSCPSARCAVRRLARGRYKAATRRAVRHRRPLKARRSARGRGGVERDREGFIRGESSSRCLGAGACGTRGQSPSRGGGGARHYARRGERHRGAGAAWDRAASHRRRPNILPLPSGLPPAPVPVDAATIYCRPRPRPWSWSSCRPRAAYGERHLRQQRQRSIPPLLTTSDEGPAAPGPHRVTTAPCWRRLWPPTARRRPK